jgi:hypothetical protein
MEGFEGLTSAFDLDQDENFKNEIKKVETNLQLIETKKADIVNRINAQLVFQDQEFIQTELRSLIMSARTVMYKVEQDIKIGADARKIEVYAKLIEAIGKQYQSLIELNKNIFDAKVQTGELDINNIGNNKISLSSEQLLDMINKASERSEMNRIEADFVVNDGIPEKRKK